MKFAYTILYVEDVAKTIAFYEKSFGFKQKFISPEKDYGELISGETSIAFGSSELATSNFKDGFTLSKPSQKPFGIELAFTSETIEQDFETAINNGAIKVSDIAEKPWGQKVAYVKDMNGFLIEICTPM